MKMNTLDMKFKKRTKKSVRFNSITYTAINTDTGTDTSPFITNDELEYNSWYDKSELMQFRQSAVDIALFQYNRSNIGDDDTNKLPRGMEGMSKHRRQHKKITLKCILLAIRCGKPPHYVASLSKKLGSWNTEIAIRDACLDYFEIYQPQQLIHNTLLPISSKPPFISLVPRTTANNTSTNTDSAAAADGNTCAATRRQRSSSSSTTINTTATSTTASTKKRGRCIGNGPSSLLVIPTTSTLSSSSSSASNHDHQHHQHQHHDHQHHQQKQHQHHQHHHQHQYHKHRKHHKHHEHHQHHQHHQHHHQQQHQHQRSSSIGIESVYTNSTYDLPPL